MAKEKGRYPGYGIIYPQKSTTGLRYIKIMADGAKKIRHADGSIEYAAPQPTIVELVGGAFAYVSGQAVNKRQDLEWLPIKVKEKALQWFDSQGFIPKEAVVNEPEPVKRTEPDADWILSNERPDLLDLDNKPAEIQEPTINKMDSAILHSLEAIDGKLGDMEERIALVEKGTPKQSDRLAFGRKKQSESMKKKWAERRAAKEAELSAAALRGIGDVPNGG